MSDVATRIRASRFEQLAAIEIEHADVRMTIVHEVGPRIVAFHHVDGENLLFWDTEQAYFHDEWRMYGGHRLWTTRPDADESEETFAPDNKACTVRQIGDCVELISPPTQARIEKSMTVTVGAGVWTIEHRLRNTGSLLWAGGAWALTCTRSGPLTSYRIPLGGGDPTWDVLTVAIPRRWAGHTSRLDDPQFVFDDDALNFRALGHEAKRMLSAPRGTIVMADPVRGELTKAAPLRAGRYPRDTNLAVYLSPDAQLVELESMSPIKMLSPGATLVHTEAWSLLRPT